MNTIITIGRQFGSAGREIGEKVAEYFFAAGFLYGLTCGYSLEKCGKIGAILSGEVIQVIGTELPDSKWEKIKEDIIMIN